jgi:NitT/TauT family transport system substrate-binding protein
MVEEPMRWLPGPVGALLLAGLVAACSPAAPAPPRSSEAPAAADSAGQPYLARAGETPIPVKVATCALTGGFVHLYTAVETDVFAKYGLAVEHTLIRGSAAALAALSVGEIQFLYCAADATIPGIASGSDAKLVAAPLVGQPYVLVGQRDVKSLADLRGKSIGAGRPGGLPARLTRLALERQGLRPGEDVEFRSTAGSQPENLQMLLAGMVQATAITPPLDAQARREGMNVIYEMNDLGLPSIYSALQTSDAMIKNGPQTVQRFVAAIAEVVQFTEKNPAVARQVLRKTLDLEDSDALDSAYQAYAVKYVNRSVRVPADAVVAALDDLREDGVQVTARGPDDITNNTFADDLERTGFLQRLWGEEWPSR